MMADFPNLMEKMFTGEDLSEGEAFAAMGEILSGKVLPVQIAGFLSALRAKGESVDEIAGFAEAMRQTMTRISSPHKLISDTCGTGGDGKGTFNISTAAAFVAAGAGIPVAKHGNRSVSSACGSADVLSACGVKVDMPKETAELCLAEIGITFLFAPHYHPAMKNVAPVRKELGIRTVFNILGPLVNPASANVQVIGVPKKELVATIAQVLKKLNRDQNGLALVIHESGYDEMILGGECACAEVGRGKIKFYLLKPSDLGMKKVRPQILKGGNAEDNAHMLREALTGKNPPLAEVVIANAALLIGLAGRFQGGMEEAAAKARESVAGGAAIRKLEELIQWSRKT